MCYYLKQQHSLSPLDGRRAMVGKLHRPSLRILDKRILCASGDEPSPLPNAQHFVAQDCFGGTILNTGPSVPQQVVIGFDIGPLETKIPDFCESPRSVLDPISLSSPPREKKKALTRSCLGGSLSAAHGSHGVGLAIIAHIRAEEELQKGAAFEVHRPPQESLPISIMSNNDQTVNRHFGKSTSKPENTESYHFCTDYSSDTVALAECFDDEMHPLLGHGHGHFIWEDDEDLDDDDKEEDDNSSRIHQKSIFAVASVPSYCSSDIRALASFDTCVFCRCAFEIGEDIFMYRGDQAFCSTECRARQIEVDEYMEKQAVWAAHNHPL